MIYVYRDPGQAAAAAGMGAGLDGRFFSGAKSVIKKAERVWVMENSANAGLILASYEAAGVECSIYVVGPKRKKRAPKKTQDEQFEDVIAEAMED